MAKLTGVQTIDMVNGEITKVSYNGEEYAKVSGQAQAGDIGVITTGWGSQQVGDYYEIMRISESCGRTYSHINGRVCNANGYVDNFEYFRKISEKSTISAKLDEIDARVTALEKAEEPKAEPLKVGDYAKVVGTKKVECYVAHSFEIGEIVRVEELGFSEGSIKGREIGGDDYDFFHPLNLVKATDEEVAEAKALAEQARKEAVFTQAGRKPNEYRKGDIVRLLKTNGHGAVEGKIAEVSDAYGGGKGGNVETTCGAISLGDYTTIVTFVESRLDRN